MDFFTVNALQRGATTFVYIVNPFNPSTVRISKWHYDRDGNFHAMDHYTLTIDKARELYRAMCLKGFRKFNNVYDNIIDSRQPQLDQFTRLFDPNCYTFDQLSRNDYALRNPKLDTEELYFE